MIVYKTKKYSLKNILITTGIGVLIVGLVVIGIYIMSPRLAAPNQQQSTDNSAEAVDNPPAQQSDTGKDAKESSTRGESEPKSTPPDTKKSVPIGISYAGVVDTDTIEVRAFMSEIIEGNGICTATFTKAGMVVSATSLAFIDATTSQCEPIKISRSAFSEDGIWNLVLSYASSDAEGISQSIEIKL